MGLCKDERKGGNNRNMTDAEEKTFLAGFEEAAKRGELTMRNFSLFYRIVIPNA